MQSTLEGYRLSPQQQRVWSLQQEGIPYYAQCLVRVDGPLDTPVLQKAVQAVVSRHEILRTGFPHPPGLKAPLQVIAEDCVPQWQTEELGDQPVQQHAAILTEHCREEQQRPLDFETGSLLHCTLFRLSQERYVLLISLPALCADTRTLHNIVQEISRFYAACLNGEPIADEPTQYLQFSEWQNELLEDEDAEAGKSYWQQWNLSPLPVVILPLERSLSNTMGCTPGVVESRIASETVAKLKTIARQYETSLAVVLLACWQTLLWRLTEQPDIVVRALCDGRKYEDLHSALGLFAKLVPVRCRFDKDRSFGEILEQVRESVNAAYAWQEYFLWEEHRAEEMAHPPVAFEYDRHPPPHEVAGVRFSIHRSVAHFDRCKVKLSCFRAEDDMAVALHYDARLFDHAEGECLIRQLDAVLRSVVADPDTPLGAISALSETERHFWLRSFNDTKIEHPQASALHCGFEAQVRRTPDRMAVVYEDQSLSYAELNTRANQIAHYLRKLGVGPEVRVALYLERSPEIIVGLLGILKAGGAYVPLDPGQPIERLMLMIADVQPAAVLTQEALEGRLAQRPEVQAVCLDRDWWVISQESGANPSSEVRGENVAYVMYTSGSTGMPKGVMIEHRNLLNYLHAISLQLDLPAGASFALLSTFAADLGNTVLFPALCGGGCLDVLSQTHASDPEACAGYFRRHPIDCLKIVPSHLEALLTAAQPAYVLPRQRLVLGGEGTAWHLATSLQSLAPQCQLFNHYGPTEATVGVMTYRVGLSESSQQSTTLPLGRPIANTQIYLLDPAFGLVPVGVPGELCIGGAGLARGYINRPDLTAEKFVPNPFGEAPGTRLYKTGDLARYLPGEVVEFLGRVDRQVKLRGFRIELGEIEVQLSEHPQIQEAVVLVWEENPGNQRLVAYVVSGRGATVEREALRDFLKQCVPNYMLPSAFVFLKALPLTPNGKVDRQALPVPDMGEQLAQTYIAPRTVTEEQLVEIWQDVLGLDRVGVQDNFFELGGDSLLAVRLAHGVRQTLARTLPLTALFQSPTVAGLAQLLREGEQTKSSLLVPICAKGAGEPLYCIHHGGGDVLEYQHLANALEGEQPVYGIQARQLLDPTWRNESLEAMAREYAQIIWRHQPTGPYHLLGWSIGGVIALAVAYALEQRGETVAFLGLLDSRFRAVYYTDPLEAYASYFTPQKRQECLALAVEERQVFHDQLMHLGPEERLEYAILWAQRRGYLPPDDSLDAFKLAYAIGEENRRLLKTHTPRVIQAPLHVWWASETLDTQGLPPTNWSVYTTGATQSEIIQGNHADVIQKPALHRKIADILARLHKPASCG